MNPAGLMVNTVTVTPKTQTVQADGTFVVTNGTTISTKASIQPRSSSESGEMLRQGGYEIAVGYFPAKKGDGSALAFAIDDEVTWGSNVYRVKGPARDVGGRGVFQVVELEREV